MEYLGAVTTPQGGLSAGAKVTKEFDGVEVDLDHGAQVLTTAEDGVGGSISGRVAVSVDPEGGAALNVTVRNVSDAPAVGVIHVSVLRP